MRSISFGTAILFIGIVSFRDFATADEVVYCDNNCQPKGATHGGYFCISGNSKVYTRCSNGVRHFFKCPNGLVWDQSKFRCDLQSAVKFQCRCVAPTTTSHAPSTTTAKHPTTLGTTTPYNPSNMKRVCYYTNWSQYRPKPASFMPSDIDPLLCTHIIYAFLNFSTSSIYLQEWNDGVLISEILRLKERNPSLKVLASIGGWAAGTSTFLQIMTNATAMDKFNKAAIKFLRNRKFDGLDINFQYPGAIDRGGTPKDKERFANWTLSLSKAFATDNTMNSTQHRLLLSAAVSAKKDHIDNGYDVLKLSAALDMINVMTYDFYGPESKTVGHNAPLLPKPSWKSDSKEARHTTSYAIKYWIEKGASRDKLLLGIPLFGRSYQLSSAENTELGAAASDPGIPGTYTQEAGINSFFEACMLYKCPKTMYTYVYDREIEAPYMYDPNGSWLSVEDTDSIAEKVRFAQSHHLSGVFFWALDFDDFNDMCENGVRYPLIRTALNVARGEPAPVLSRNFTSTDYEVCGASTA